MFPSHDQVVSADGTTHRNITSPAADWASNYPTFGLVYRSRLWCFGNTNLPDFLYASAEADYENFNIPATPTVTSARFIDVFPGEGDGISGAFVFKNKLFVCKNPTGLYVLNDDDLDPDNWYFTRVNADFGLSGPHGVAQIFDDVLLFNSQGTVTVLSAAFQFGNIESSDLFNSNLVERYFRQIVSGYGIKNTQALYPPRS